MASRVDISKLVKAVADAYNVDELRGFLADYFQVRLDHIINPVGIGLIAIVRAVVDHFEARHALTDFVREIQKDRPGVIDLLALLLPAGVAPSAPPPGSPPASVDVQADELDFYFVIEPDRRTVPPASAGRPTQSIYVRIPAVASAGRGVLPRALSLAVDRSGSMAGRKTDIARAAADYLLDLAEGSSDKVAIVAFDHRVNVAVALRSISSSSALKAQLRTLNPDGDTDIFAAWERCVQEVRPLSDSWDRRVVLITDGQLNHGVVDPSRFERDVRKTWMHERIATSCISMGDDWNVDLLNKLAGAGGGSIHFINDERQAEQALHEAFHAGRAIVATNLQADLEPLGSARVTQVQGVPRALVAGTRSTHPITSQLRANVEESLVLRIEFPPPPSGQAAEILRCQLLYEDPVDARQKSAPEKVLRIYSDETTAVPGRAVVHQGVVCTAHTAMSHQLFRQALGAFLHGDAHGGRALLEQSRFSLEAAPAPRGYQATVNLQQRRIQDVERFEGQVPVEYIKERYIEELAHRDVVWIKLCEVLDRLTEWMFQIRRGAEELFRWADRMVDELAQQLPVHAQQVRRVAQERPDQDGDKPDSARRFWIDRAHEWIERLGESDESSDRHEEHEDERSPVSQAVIVVAGACLGFERRRQGTREELTELMDGYLQSFLQHRGPRRWR